MLLTFKMFASIFNQLIKKLISPLSLTTEAAILCTSPLIYDVIYTVPVITFREVSALSAIDLT